MLQLESLKTISFDITDSVFDRCKAGIMYVTKDDVYEDCFIVSVPVINFSYSIKDESDFQQLLKDESLIADRIIRENVVKVVRLAIVEFD